MSQLAIGIVIFESDLRRANVERIVRRICQSTVAKIAIEAPTSGEESGLTVLAGSLQENQIQVSEFLFSRGGEFRVLGFGNQSVICFVQNDHDANALKRFQASCSRDTEIRICGPASAVLPLASVTGLVPMPLFDSSGREPVAWEEWPHSSVPMGISLGLGNRSAEDIIAEASQIGFQEVWFWSLASAVTGKYLDSYTSKGARSSPVPQRPSLAESLGGTVRSEVHVRASASRTSRIVGRLEPGQSVSFISVRPSDLSGDVYGKLGSPEEFRDRFVILSAGHQQYIERTPS